MSLVYAGVCCHAPGITNRPAAADPAEYASLQREFARMRAAIESSRPDALFVISAEHFANFFSNNMPAFSIGMADHYDGPIEDPEWLGIAKTRVPGNQDLSRRLTALTLENADVYFGHGTDNPADDVAPSWSRDGRWLYFASNRDGDWQIYRLTLDDASAPERITLYGGVAAAEGPGGTLLVVRSEQDGLWRLRLGEDGLPLDQQATPLPTRLSPADWANWTVEGNYVYVLERRFDGEVAIIRVDPLGREREWVASTTGVPEQPGLGVFPGARRFLVSQSERSDSDILLVRDFE